MRLLEDNHLPVDGLLEHLGTTIVARDRGRIVGSAALERYRDGALLPGAFAQVHLALQNQAAAVLVPAGALLFRSEGLRVGVVGADGRVQLRPITIGRDLGATVEVISGLKGDEALIASPPDSLLDGQTVRIASRSQQAGAPAQPP